MAGPFEHLSSQRSKIGQVRYDSAKSYPPRSGPRRVRYQLPRLGLNRLDSDESIEIPSSRLCHERLRLRGLGKKTEGCINASEHLRGVVVLGKKKKRVKRLRGVVV
uniref:Uncharacterized protein n=1 Tax=Vitis vinifera TaxID=29760 RepID=A5BFD1_VITVI|nr:hypothetical protein VITISV_031392 [Vitis vinifera]